MQMPNESPPDDHSAKPALSLTALSLADAAKLLTKAGGGATVTEEALRADIDNGAPLNPDGTLHLVAYAAWLVQEVGNRD